MKDTSGLQTLESMSQAVWYNRWTLQRFQDFLGGEILEVGCGIGNFTETLSKFGKVTAIDINEYYVKKLKERLGSRVNVGVGNIETGKYFFKQKKYDCLVCINVLEHIENDKKALGNMAALLRKGGNLILIVPAHQALYGKIDESIGHFRRYDRKILEEKLKQAGLRVIKMRKLNFLGGAGWYFFSRIFQNSHVKEGNIKIFNLLAPFFLSLEKIVEPPFGTSILVVSRKN